MKTLQVFGLSLLFVACGGAGARARGVAAVRLPARTGGAVTAALGSPHVGDAAPDFTLPGVDGQPVTLSSLRGAPVVLSFGTSWCPFSQALLPQLARYARQAAPQGVKTILVDVHEPEAAYREYAGREPVTFPVLRDASGDVARAYAPSRAQPALTDRSLVPVAAVLLIDAEGVIRHYTLADSLRFADAVPDLARAVDALTADAGGDFRALRASVADAVVAPAGGHGELHVAIAIADGYHVMSDHPGAPNLIATRVTLDTAPHLTWSEVQYPEAVPFRVGEDTLSTFAGTGEVVVPFDVPADAPAGPRAVRGAVHYQACTASTCLFPADATFTFTLDVRSGS